MTSIGPLGDLRWRLATAAIGAGVIAVVAMASSEFAAVDSALLPLVAVGFGAKARWPTVSNLVVAVPALVAPLTINIVNATENDFSMFLLVLAVALVGSLEEDRWLSTALPVTAMAVIFVLSIVGVYDWLWGYWVAAVGLSWGLGTAIYRNDRVLSELRAAQAGLLDQATLEERRRIARDVHDLVGHSLSVVLLHVAGARRLLRSDPDEAERALLQAEEAGRSSMAEVRRTVGLLRAEGDSEGSAPAPDLADIAEVVEQYRSAGMDVDLRVSGPLASVGGPQAVACYRIVQEALANVTKHTDGAEVKVVVEVAEHCQVTVTDGGGRPAPPRHDGLVDGQGHGLIGMRERALSVGGSLLAGPVGDGWSVEVTVPLTAGVDR